MIESETTVAESPASVDLELVDRLWHRVSERIKREPLPAATYRLQFNSGFTFRDATRIIPGLAWLGITHIYASPYLKACAGSPHGYNIVDHAHLNPELGTEADYEEFVRALSEHGMRQILDFVPNHMGVDGNDNEWWMDVLVDGPSSQYASFFDIDWMPLKPDLANKVLLPILGDQFGNVLEAGQLKVEYAEGQFWLHYYDRRLPIAPRSTRLILQHRIDELERRLGPEHPQLLEYHSILTALRNLPLRTETDPERLHERRREREVIKRRMNDLTGSSPEVDAFLKENLQLINGTPGDARSFDLLDELLQDQAYRLSYWRVATDEINYRRFFDINELAAICMENPRVFAETHRLVLRLIEEGKLHGLRIDHADGLFDPRGYLCELQRSRFRQLCWNAASEENLVLPEARPTPAGGAGQSIGTPNGNGTGTWEAIEGALLARFEARLASSPAGPADLPLYVVVEKILEGAESLPGNWPTQGTTGYEFLAGLNGLFVDSENAAAFDRIYGRFTHELFNFRELSYQGKKLIVRASMSSEVNVLGYQLDRLSERNRRSRDFTRSSLTYAIREIIACFPVYRTYSTEDGLLERDRLYVTAAVARAKLRNPAFSASIFDFVRDVLLLKYPDNSTPEEQQEQRRFVFRFQQVTGPVTAKGVEDTAYYRFNRLVSLNEVGGSPERFGCSVASFHRQNEDRQRVRPYALLATSTHDSKRSEDVRARINVLSEIPQEWKASLNRWSRLNRRKKIDFEGQPAPVRNDEYLLYQTLIGTWPLARPSGDSLRDYVDRIRQYMLKAAREAKVYTSWISPNEGYEKALVSFIDGLLDAGEKNHFLADLARFAERVSEFGMWNSLAQTTLKLLSPGVPDTYQGTELWDFTLVDPDNRRPVDYELRRRYQAEMSASFESGDTDRANLLRGLIDFRRDGRIKMFLTAELLRFRRDHQALFTCGEYIPVPCEGRLTNHVVAFVRRNGGNAAIVVVPRLVCGLLQGKTQVPCGAVWEDTRLVLPDDLRSARFRDRLSHRVREVPAEGGQTILLAELLRDFPITVLERVE